MSVPASSFSQTSTNASNEHPLLKALYPVLKQRKITLDEAQLRAIDTLEAFYTRWLALRRKHQWFSWFKRPQALKGIYIWGGVGRGKSFLMDSFFETLPEEKKSRWHFHAFMRKTHAMLAEHKYQNDPLVYVAKQLAKEMHLLCFDEFHISDIADAMILGRLFEHLFAQGVSIILTSNYPPDQLYPNGLQRQNFLPTIDLLKKHLEIIEIDAGIDYRHRSLSYASLYYAPLTPATEEQLKESFLSLSGTLTWNTSPLTVNSRAIQVVARCEHIIWFDFEALCGTTRSQHDYLVLAEQFDTLIISCIPQLSSDQAPEAIRFKWLIDILYDHRVKLMLSSYVAIQNICPIQHPNSEFSRTLSRLTEMQSDTYLHEAKRPVLESDFSHHTKDNIQEEAVEALIASS
ncbi:MAG: cell division protein ZapE [Pseudomonadota bacterium]